MARSSRNPPGRRSFVSRVEGALAALMLVAATLLVAEWIHYRQGDSSLWSVLRPTTTELPPEALGSARRADVSESEFESYLGVLSSMQADHELAIDDAAQAAQLSLDDFRDIEQRVQRNDNLVERARDRLRKKAETLWDSRQATLEQG